MSARLQALQRRFARDVAGAPAGSRLGIYRRNAELVRARALGLVFPTGRRVVGEECFERVALRYVRETPCRVGSLDHEGRGFHAQWAELVEATPGFEELGYLPDLARLERARHDASIAPEDAKFDWSSLEDADPDRQGEWVFLPAASLRVVRTEWDLLALFDVPAPERTGALWVRRVGDEVTQGAATPGMARLLERVIDHATLGALAEAGLDADIEGAIARGFITGVRLPGGAAS